jgi:hypothetical protein
MSSHRIVKSVAASMTVALALGATASARGPEATPDAASFDFAREVQPILAASCVRCHAGGLGA